MADVFRGKTKGLGSAALVGYAFHGVTALLALWLVGQALAS